MCNYRISAIVNESDCNAHKIRDSLYQNVFSMFAISMALPNKESKSNDKDLWNSNITDVLNFGVGAPGSDLLQPWCDHFQRATSHCLKREKEENKALIFQYGPPSGVYEVRREIANYFSTIYEDSVLSEDLLMTSGATHGLHIILTTLIDLNGYVFVDEFTFMFAIVGMKHFTGMKIIPIKLNYDGVDLADLEENVSKLQFKSKSKEFWGMYYTIPTYHNPTGILFTPSVCRGIVRLARKYDVLVVCDDVYNTFHYGDKPEHSRLLNYDSRTDVDFLGNVISNVSFSKIIAPGLRLGWLEVPSRVKPQLENCAFVDAGGPNNYAAGIVRSLFELNLAQPQIARMHEAFKKRMLATIEILRAELPKGCTFFAPSGGFFIWITIPEHLDTRDFLKYSIDNEKISFLPGSSFAAKEGKGKHFFRLAISFHETVKLVDGVKRLCLALKTFIDAKKV